MTTAPSKATARARLNYVIAADRFKFSIGRMTQGNYLCLMLEKYLQPCLLLEKFAKVQPLPATLSGQTIKWRQTIPFKV